MSGVEVQLFSFAVQCLKYQRERECEANYLTSLCTWAEWRNTPHSMLLENVLWWMSGVDNKIFVLSFYYQHEKINWILVITHFFYVVKMESNKRMQSVKQWHLSHIRLLWSGCCLAWSLKRQEEISGGWLLLTWSKHSVQSSCPVPTEQTAAKGNLLALAWFVELCQLLMTAALHQPRTGAAQAIKEDDYINAEHRSFVCSFS